MVDCATLTLCLGGIFQNVFNSSREIPAFMFGLHSGLGQVYVELSLKTNLQNAALYLAIYQEKTFFFDPCLFLLFVYRSVLQQVCTVELFFVSHPGLGRKMKEGMLQGDQRRRRKEEGSN